MTHERVGRTRARALFAVLAATTFALSVPAIAPGQGKSDQAPGHDPAGPGNSENAPPAAAPAQQAHEGNARGRDGGEPGRDDRPAAKRKGQAKAKKHNKANTNKAGHANNGVPHQKVTLCHATGSATNPFVKITISVRAVEAHKRHQDGRDIIPAPAAGCPGPPPGQQATVTPPNENRAVPATTSDTAPAVTGGVAPTVLAQTPAAVQVLGVRAGDAPRAARRVAPARASAPRSLSREAAGRLPFTGWDTVFVAILGAAALLTGFALYRAGVVRDGDA